MLLYGPNVFQYKSPRKFVEAAKAITYLWSEIRQKHCVNMYLGSICKVQRLCHWCWTELS